MTVGHVAAVAGGIAICAGTFSSVVRTLVVPRGLASIFARVVIGGAMATVQTTGRRIKDYERRDRLLAWGAPLGVLGLLVAWLASFYIGYTVIGIGLSNGVAGSLRDSGSSLFTLGFAVGQGSGSTALDFAAAATGPVVIALQIAYLPTLYSSYNRREVAVTLLESRAGEPAWGPELLARHQLISSLDALPELYSVWERWAADVSESHTSYPMLIHFRSPQPYRSWVVGLLAVMDSAAIYLSRCPSTAPTQARMCLRMGFVALRNIASVNRIAFDADPLPHTDIELPREEFTSAFDRLDQVGFPGERSVADAWPHFRGWRVNYEQLAYGIAYQLDAVPALWSGPRRGAATAMAPRRPRNRRPDNPDDLPT
jgi:hypothetical protein